MEAQQGDRGAILKSECVKERERECVRERVERKRDTEGKSDRVLPGRSIQTNFD